MENFVDNSYKKHTEEFNTQDEASVKKQESWFDESTIDYWRHFRMVEPVSPLLKLNPQSKWLTVGDGRFGLDSIKLKKIEPNIKIVASDISPYLLEKAKNRGIISEYSVENAEKLSFSDESFDYVFCKEAYHHFPRPYIAVYEMLRVSKKAIIFSEPNDHMDVGLLGTITTRVKNIVKRVLGKAVLHHDHFKFEESGNYIYSVSRREIEKIALAINLRVVAVKYLNDYYEKGVEFQKADSDNTLFKKVTKEINKKDLLSKIGYAPYGGIIAIIFKQNPSEAERVELKNNGFCIIDLPLNPYA